MFDFIGGTPQQVHVLDKVMSPTLHVQLDNCTNDNKCRYVLCFWSLLIAKGIFKELFVCLFLERRSYT